MGTIILEENDLRLFILAAIMVRLSTP